MIVTGSIKEYIQGNQIRSLVPAKVSADGILYKHNGEWISADRFNSLYPAYEYKKFNDKGDNLDKTKIP